MKKRMNQVIVGMLSSLLCGSGVLVWTGCDTASSTESLEVSPSSVTLTPGQSQTFTVSGGYHYTWALEGSSSASGTTSSAQGTLSSLTGSQVVYTAPSGDSLAGSVTLIVTSTIEGSGSATSNSPAYAVEGMATINFYSALSPMVINPSVKTIGTAGTEEPFTVSGGTAPYRWSVTKPDVGNITGVTGAIATYKAISVGENTIICDDANDRRATATIK